MPKAEHGRGTEARPLLNEIQDFSPQITTICMLTYEKVAMLVGSGRPYLNHRLHRFQSPLFNTKLFTINRCPLLRSLSLSCVFSFFVGVSRFATDLLAHLQPPRCCYALMYDAASVLYIRNAIGCFLCNSSQQPKVLPRCIPVISLLIMPSCIVAWIMVRIKLHVLQA